MALFVAKITWYNLILWIFCLWNKCWAKVVDNSCLIDSGTTHTILWDRKYFSNLTIHDMGVTVIIRAANIIEDSGVATFLLPRGTILHIKNSHYSSKSNRNLLCGKDININGYHFETVDSNDRIFLLITSIVNGQK